jgi:hypothetical protein
MRVEFWTQIAGFLALLGKLNFQIIGFEKSNSARISNQIILHHPLTLKHQ